MMDTKKWVVATGAIVVACTVTMGFAEAAHAVPLTCQRTIARESSRYVQSVVKALVRCEDRRVAGRLPASTDCQTDATTASLIQRAHDKLAIRVASNCGGPDRACGSADDDPLASIGWGSGVCPNLQGAACNNPIANCNDISTCLTCVGSAEARQAISF